METSFFRGPIVAAAGLALLVAACGSDLTLPEDDGGVTPPPPPPPPPSGALAIAVDDGDDQEGVVGEMLAGMLVVRITGDDGEPMPGRGVVFEPSGEAGDVTPDTAVTNDNGRASSRWTLGTAAGTQSAAARIIGSGGSVTFTATAAAGPAHAMAMVSGDNQTGAPLVALADPLVVSIRDRYGNPVAGVSVGWSVEAGRGSLSADEVVTDSDGHAAVTWTLGVSVGKQRARARVNGLDGSPIDFEAGII